MTRGIATLRILPPGHGKTRSGRRHSTWRRKPTWSASAAGLDAAKQQLTGLGAEIAVAKADVAQAEADLHTAELDPPGTPKFAPRSTATSAIAPLQDRLALCSLGCCLSRHRSSPRAHDLWNANFKESQLEHMTPRDKRRHWSSLTS